ncbi:sugar phosphate nucleotidyltransferase [Pseudoalteromonas fenneropenaei]|uniref:Sugar phosphate nucleotidyltransferase n=1 Tax=Pseudoalteromonas fenneropenaei TaxID=1737459 RepID=A0ABV7CLI2_9GAMM
MQKEVGAATEVSLFILAGGLGSRFGGGKQIANLPGFDCTIMELSILDAYAAGVTRVVLIINAAVRKVVEQQILARLPPRLQVELVEQHISDLPEPYQHLALSREKPWGTGHALWCARHQITGPSIVITADDHYGDHAYQQLVEHFKSAPDCGTMVAYPLQHTLSAQGGVNRGICQLQHGKLQSVVEHTNITLSDELLHGVAPDGTKVELAENALASMTIWGITPAFVPVLNADFLEFLNTYDNGVRKEYYLPDGIQQAIDQHQLEIQVYTATQPWLGITYREELNHVAEQIHELRHG